MRKTSVLLDAMEQIGFTGPEGASHDAGEVTPPPPRSTAADTGWAPRLGSLLGLREPATPRAHPHRPSVRPSLVAAKTSSKRLPISAAESSLSPPMKQSSSPAAEPPATSSARSSSLKPLASLDPLVVPLSRKSSPVISAGTSSRPPSTRTQPSFKGPRAFGMPTDDSWRSAAPTRERFLALMSDAGWQRLLEMLFIALLGVLTALLSLFINFVATLFASAKSRLASAAGWRISHVAYHVLGLPAPSAAIIGILGSWTAFMLTALAFASFTLAATVDPPRGIGAKHAIGSGIPEMKVILAGFFLQRYLSWKTLRAKIMGLCSALSAGYCIGREGPLVHMCACLAHGLLSSAPFFERIGSERRLQRAMLVAACAIGVVSTFGTPIGGVLFSIEVTTTHYMVSNLWRSFFGAICAVVCFQLFSDLDLVSEVPITRFTWEPHIGWEYSIFFSIGILQGLLAVLIVAVFTRVYFGLRRHRLLPYRRRATGLAVCAMCNAAVLTLPPMGRSPHSVLSDLFTDRQLTKDHAWSLYSQPLLALFDLVDTGSTRQEEWVHMHVPPPPAAPTLSTKDTVASDMWSWLTANRAPDLSGELRAGGGSEDAARADGEGPSNSPTGGYSSIDELPVLALYAAIQLCLLVASIAMPIPAGCFLPVFLLGAITGRLYAELLHTVWGFDGSALPAAVCSVIGAAALAGAVTHTLSTTVLVLELTGQNRLLRPVLLAVTVAVAVSQMFSNSIYDQVILLKCLPCLPHMRNELAASKKAEDIMRPTEAVAEAAQSKRSREKQRESPKLYEQRYELPRKNPFHPSSLLPGYNPRPMPVLSLEHTMREVLDLADRGADKFVPLTRTRNDPIFLGEIAISTLRQWFRDHIQYEADEGEYLYDSSAASPVGRETGGNCIVVEQSPAATPDDATLDAASLGAVAPVAAEPGTTTSLPRDAQPSATEDVEPVPNMPRVTSSFLPPTPAKSRTLPSTSSGLSAEARGRTDGPTAQQRRRRNSAIVLARLMRDRVQDQEDADVSSPISPIKARSWDTVRRRRGTMAGMKLAHSWLDGVRDGTDSVSEQPVTTRRRVSSYSFTPSGLPPRRHRASTSEDVGVALCPPLPLQPRVSFGGDSTPGPAEACAVNSTSLDMRASLDMRLSASANSQTNEGSSTDTKRPVLQRVLDADPERGEAQFEAFNKIQEERTDDRADEPPSSLGAQLWSKVSLSALLAFAQKSAQRYESVPAGPSDSPAGPPFGGRAARGFSIGDGDSELALHRWLGVPRGAEEELENFLSDQFDEPFPLDEVQYNPCALQMSTETVVEEVHSLFTFMQMNQVWITQNGRIRGVLALRHLIEGCMSDGFEAERRHFAEEEEAND